jgi:hypothetical protein
VEKQLEIPSVTIHLLSDLEYTFMISNGKVRAHAWVCVSACARVCLGFFLAGSGSISS